MTLKPLNEQVVVIVGASSGIGRDAARRLAERGARVVVAARSVPGLTTLVNEIRARGGDALPVVADVTNAADMRAVADAAAARYGRLDTWVHVAGVAMWAAVEHTTPEEFRRVVEVNLLGQVHGAMAALPHLRREGRGALIHVSSGESQFPLPLQSAYGASKHGLAGFLDALRMELRHDGIPISVTNVMPSGINTPIFDKARNKQPHKPRPLPPMYEPSVVSDAIVYAAEHPTREIFAGGASKIGVLARHAAPGLTEAVLAKTAMALQRTRERDEGQRPDNLYEPRPELDAIEGRFGRESRSFSLGTWLATHPSVRRAAALALVALLLAQRLHGGDARRPARRHIAGQ